MCFRVDVSSSHLADRSRSAIVPQMLVDTGSEATWVPREILEQLGIPRRKVRTFRAGNERFDRDVGYAILRIAPDLETADEVVFAEADDPVILGARSLTGLNVRVDPERKTFVAGGPSLAAAA